MKNDLLKVFERPSSMDLHIEEAKEEIKDI